VYQRAVTACLLTLTAVAPQDAGALVEELIAKRDEADPALIDELAAIGSREALDGLIEVYDAMGSILMRRETVRAIARFDGVEGMEQTALQKVADVATSAPEPELHMAAVDALGESLSMGKHFLKLIVDSPAETSIRMRAMEHHVQLGSGGDEDMIWYESLFSAPERMEKEKNRQKKGAEQVKAVKSLLGIRELALREVAPTFKTSKLVDLAREKVRDPQEPSRAGLRRIALEELVRREDRKAKSVAQDVFKDQGERPENRAFAARILYDGQGDKLATKFIDEGTRDPSVMPLQLRLALAEMVDEMDAESSKKKLIKMISKEKWPVKLFCVRALKSTRDAKLYSALLQLLDDQRKDVRIAAVEALAERDEEATLPALMTRIEKEQQENVILAMMKAVSQLKATDETWIGKLESYVEHEKPQIRNGALHHLAELGDPQHEPLYFTALQNENWSTRAAALQILEALRTAEATGAIIEQMSEEDGFMLNRFADALWRLTGEPHRTAVRRWESWWKDNQAGFEPIDAEELARREAEEERRRLMQTTKATTFFGIRVLSKRVVFILDVSGSMDWELQSEYVGERGRPRIEVAKRELQRCLEQLQDDSLFNIIVFSSDVERWLDGGIAESNASAKEEAMEFVERLGAGGGTNVFAALEEAFRDQDVDSIFVLSDGEPSVGAETDPWRIREIVQQWNENRGVVIHTIAVGGSFQILEWLAEDSGGNHVKFD
jgi:HEAT repeat protein